MAPQDEIHLDDSQFHTPPKHHAGRMPAARSEMQVEHGGKEKQLRHRRRSTADVAQHPEQGAQLLARTASLPHEAQDSSTALMFFRNNLFSPRVKEDGGVPSDGTYQDSEGGKQPWLPDALRDRSVAKRLNVGQTIECFQARRPSGRRHTQTSGGHGNYRQMAAERGHCGLYAPVALFCPDTHDTLHAHPQAHAHKLPAEGQLKDAAPVALFCPEMFTVPEALQELEYQERENWMCMFQTCCQVAPLCCRCSMRRRINKGQPF